MTAGEPLEFEIADEAGTAALGRALAGALPERALVCLNGTLGAGKTRLVQAVAESVGLDRRDVVSPTFVLMQEYHGQHSIYHVDAYRLRDEDEFLQLGVDEQLERDGWVFIEWGERIDAVLPADRLDLRIVVLPGERRRCTLVARSGRLQAVVEQLRPTLAGQRT